MLFGCDYSSDILLDLRIGDKQWLQIPLQHIVVKSECEWVRLWRESEGKRLEGRHSLID